MTEIDKFEHDRDENINSYEGNKALNASAKEFMDETLDARYSYNFSWMGRPIIQYPQDMVAMQEIIWNVKPDLIIETGIAHGGSIIMYASYLELLGGEGMVLGIDIDIREHNRKEIENHSMFKRITLLEGSSVSEDMYEKVKAIAGNYRNIMVVLDSNHTHEHVLKELELFAPLVSVGSYCVVFDTVVEDMKAGSFADRPWDIGDNPKTAVWEYLKDNADFEVDKAIDNKLQISVAPEGYLKRISKN